MAAEHRLDVIIEKVNKLKESNSLLHAHNQTLETEIKGLKEKLLAETERIEELNNKIKIIKLAQNIGTTDKENADITELKRKINEYIKEIDHCITMLND